MSALARTESDAGGRIVARTPIAQGTHTSREQVDMQCQHTTPLTSCVHGCEPEMQWVNTLHDSVSVYWHIAERPHKGGGTEPNARRRGAYSTSMA
jgi:hypothetical protein